MNNIKNKIEWDKYIMAMSPIFLIFYISNETYAIDYRAFYLAGKSVLNNLNPLISIFLINLFVISLLRQKHPLK